MLVYAALRRVFSLLLWVWYREIAVVGAHHVPRKRPVLLCGNHQNMVHDPLLIALTVPHRRQCHFWAMKELFTPWFGPVLRSVGAVPVDRRTKDNALLYKETFETLQDDGCMAMFPEGTSYTQPHMLELKDGASRAALEFAKYLWEKDGKPDLATYRSFHTALLLPVGINYEHKDRWRSRVVVEYGPPIVVDEYLADYVQSDAKTTVKRLTDVLYQSMRGLTVNAPDWETLDLINLSLSVILPRNVDLPSELRMKLLQSLSDAYSRTADDTDVQRLRQDLQTYQRLLRQYGLEDEHVAKHSRKAVTMTRAVRYCLASTWKVVLSVPYMVPGLLLHAPIFLAAYMARSRQKYTEQVAQDMLTVMLVAVPVLYVSVTALLLYVFRRTSLWMAVVVIVLLGVAAHWQLDAFDKGQDHMHDLRQNIVLARLVFSAKGRGELDRLADMRWAIQRFHLRIIETYRQATDDAVAHFLAQSLSSLHSRG